VENRLLRAVTCFDQAPRLLVSSGFGNTTPRCLGV